MEALPPHLGGKTRKYRVTGVQITELQWICVGLGKGHDTGVENPWSLLLPILEGVYDKGVATAEVHGNCAPFSRGS